MLHIEQACFSFASLILLVLIQCINIHYNGSLTCLKWPSRMLFLQKNFKIDLKISIITLLIHCIKTFVVHFLKNTSFYSLSCLLLKFNQGKINLIHMNGDIYLLDQAVKSKSSKILQIGSHKVRGLIFTVNSME